MKTVVFIQGAGEGAHDVDDALAASLQRELGADYEVRYPQMPNEGDPDFETWKPTLAREIARAGRDPILVGHSAGAYMLLKYLSEDAAPAPPRGLFLIATPFPCADENWQIPGVSVPPDLDARLPTTAQIVFYHSPDDRSVPFAHMALYAQVVPRALVRETTGGHQLNNDLSVIARDIQRLP